MTLFVFAVSFAVGTLIGFVLAVIRQRRVPVASQLAVVYVELFRNSPLLVQLFLVFFGMPSIFGIRFTPIEAGLITLSVNTGAFMTVIVQAAIEEVPRGQWEAARSSGLGYVATMRYVVLPQAVRAMIPPTVSLAVGQLQVSSLISIIGVVDLAKVGTNLNLRTLAPFKIWPIVALGYFLVSKPLSMLADWTEARLKTRGTALHLGAEGMH
jgi:His/Glu/Gln/Arg/opine family amino acid ABC transporter permease subunit